MTQVESLFLRRRLKAQMAVICLNLQKPGSDRDEAIFILEEYSKLMETPIDPNKTRGRIV